MKNRNLRTVTVKITRHQLSDLVMICKYTSLEANNSQQTRTKWEDLAQTLLEQLNTFDKKIDLEE